MFWLGVVLGAAAMVVIIAAVWIREILEMFNKK